MQYTEPTIRQRRRIQEYHMNPDEWLVMEETDKGLKLIHRRNLKKRRKMIGGELVTMAILVLAALATVFALLFVKDEPKEEPIEPPVVEEVVIPEEIPMVEIKLFDVPLSEELQMHIISEAESKGIDPAVIVAMAYRETGYDASAIGDGGDSYGLLQIQPKWHYQRMQDLNCNDLLDPFQNVTVGVDILSELIDRYGDLEKALVAYNRGSYNGTITEYAQSVMEKSKEL